MRFRAFPLLFIPVLALAQSSPWEYQQEEAARFFAGLNSIQTEGWGPINARVLKVQEQLIEFGDGKVFKVVPAQTNTWGQAHANGWILFDISSAAADQPIMAFRLAHEWGHEALGHAANIYHPTGRAWEFKRSPTQHEDEADEFAGRFLAKYNYDLDTVVAHLKRVPQAHGDVSHSTGKQRAETVARAYRELDSSAGRDDDATRDPADCRDECRDTRDTCFDDAMAEFETEASEGLANCTAVGCPCDGLIGISFMRCRQACNDCLERAKLKSLSLGQRGNKKCNDAWLRCKADCD